MKKVVLAVVVDAKVDVEVTVVTAEIVEIAEIEVAGRTRAETRISRRMMIAKLASWAPVRAKRSDKVVDVMDVVVAIVVIVVTVAAIVSVATVDAKSAVTAVTVESKVSEVIVRSVHLSPVNVNNASRSSWTKRLAST